MQIDIFDFNCDDLLMDDIPSPIIPKQETFDFESFEPAEYHLIHCDHLWDEAGELAQKAFEDFSRKKTKQMICFPQDNKKKEPEIKCTSLLEWIEENVEII